MNKIIINFKIKYIILINLIFLKFLSKFILLIYIFYQLLIIFLKNNILYFYFK